MSSSTGSGGSASATTEIEQVTPDELAYRAYGLRVKGYSWQQIAYELGYSSVTTARRSVSILIGKARDSVTEEHKSEIINLELDRLDALQAAVWDAAVSGDTRSVDAALKIMSHRARLLQLGEETASSSRTVIITSDDYVSKLKELAEE